MSINPNSAAAGGPAFSLSVTGAGFNGPGQRGANSQVRWNGSFRNTTFNSVTSLTAAISAADIAAAGTATVQVFNGGTGSNQVTFTINNPVPVISSISPSSTLRRRGSIYLDGHRQWLCLRFHSSLAGRKPHDDVWERNKAYSRDSGQRHFNHPGPRTVTVFNPAPGGGASNGVTFTVTPPNPVPSVSSLNPNSASGWRSRFYTDGQRHRFCAKFCGSMEIIHPVRRHSLTARVFRQRSRPATLPSAGTAAITVLNPAPGGGGSNSVSFTIIAQNPAPSIGAIDPTSTNSGKRRFHPYGDRLRLYSQFSRSMERQQPGQPVSLTAID